MGLSLFTVVCEQLFTYDVHGGASVSLVSYSVFRYPFSLWNLISDINRVVFIADLGNSIDNYTSPGKPSLSVCL